LLGEGKRGCDGEFSAGRSGSNSLPPRVPSTKLTQPRELQEAITLPPPPPDDAEDGREIILDIDIGGGRTASITVDEGADPILKAFSFLRDHSLPPDYLEPLAAYIQNTLAQIAKDQSDTLGSSPAEMVESFQNVSSPTLASTSHYSVPLSSTPKQKRHNTSSPSGKLKQLQTQNEDFLDGSHNSNRHSARPGINVQTGESKEKTVEDMYEEAVRVFDSATELANEGHIQEAARLYQDSLRLFERVPFTSSDHLTVIRDEVNYWTGLAQLVKL
jgi:hypothetical protein